MCYLLFLLTKNILNEDSFKEYMNPVVFVSLKYTR